MDIDKHFGHRCHVLGQYTWQPRTDMLLHEMMHLQHGHDGDSQRRQPCVFPDAMLHAYIMIPKSLLHAGSGSSRASNPSLAEALESVLPMTSHALLEC